MFVPSEIVKPLVLLPLKCQTMSEVTVLVILSFETVIPEPTAGFVPDVEPDGK